MSRELKFRAWNTKEKWMDTEFVIHADGHIYQDARRTYDTPNQEIESDYDGLLIMQYTGLKDKNGKEIYEGDIVTDYEGLTSHVEWQDGSWYLPWISDFLYDSYSEVKIIGNIHENPELLN